MYAGVPTLIPVCVMREPADALVIYGITGDLAFKKIFPALQALVQRGRLNVPIIGVARSAGTLEQLVERARTSLEAAGTFGPAAFEKLSPLFRLVSGDYNDRETFSRLRQGANVAIVALSGDRGPFDALGVKLRGPIGHLIVQANLDDGTVTQFIRNVREGPRSRHRDPHDLELERPVDVKFGPDGALYILDMGKLDVRKGRERVPGGTGKIYKLVGVQQ